MYKLNNMTPINNPNFKSLQNSLKDLEREIKEKYEKKKYYEWYTVIDESMNPEIKVGQSVKVFKNINIFNENDIYLVSTPDSILVRRLKIVDETVILICTNIRCNNEEYLVDDVKIIGKVYI